jgi:drug/metabolite transporter (DMT)-like permease
MAILLGLLSALAYGASDFAGGLASRRLAPGPVTAVSQALGLLTAGIAVILFPGVGPRAAALAWGAVAGIGAAVGTMALYHGLSVARMSVVATLSAVLTAVIPALVGVALGNRLSPGSAAGIVVAVPAIGLVSWQPDAGERAAARAGTLSGVLAGLGFALLFIALDRAHTRSGAWPLVVSQAVSLVLIIPVAHRGLTAAGRLTRSAAALTVTAGLLAGLASISFLAATGHGQLAIVAVMTALYPAVTVLLARTVLSEHWTRTQAAGLLAAAAAIVLVSAS